MYITIDTFPDGTIDTVSAKAHGEVGGRVLLNKLCPEPETKTRVSTTDLSTLEKFFELYRGGAKIQMIKLVRESFPDFRGDRMGLKEAKEWVEKHAPPVGTKNNY